MNSFELKIKNAVDNVAPNVGDQVSISQIVESIVLIPKEERNSKTKY
jgi:hypothetical protein